ncbi:hypothetical protein E2320_012278 [Naja naja]|nr:hypothetical protein E2320_012278 [Naja naja]
MRGLRKLIRHPRSHLRKEEGKSSSHPESPLGRSLSSKGTDKMRHGGDSDPEFDPGETSVGRGKKRGEFSHIFLPPPGEIEEKEQGKSIGGFVEINLTFTSFQDSLPNGKRLPLVLPDPFHPGAREEHPFSPSPSQGIERTLHLLSIAVYGVACLLGVTGNGLVIWIASFKMEKTVNVVWFLNLALADFVFTFFLPLSIAYTALGFHWPFGRFLCKLNSSLAFLNMFASVFLLTVISLDRCLLVVLPVWSRNHRKPRLAWAIALATWGAALLISSPYFLFRDTALSARNATSCYNNFALSGNYSSEGSRRLWQKRHRAMILARFVFGFLLPFTVIAACHGVVAFQVQRRHLAKSPKPLRIIAAVTASFFLCYSPYHILSLLEMSKTSGSPVVKRVLHLGVPLASSLAFFNSCLNPLLYVFVGQKSFRRSVRGCLKGPSGRTPSCPGPAGGNPGPPPKRRSGWRRLGKQVSLTVWMKQEGSPLVSVGLWGLAKANWIQLFLGGVKDLN